MTTPQPKDRSEDRLDRAFAALAGRDYVSPDDVAALGVSVLAHRVLPSTDAQLARRTVSDVVAHAITSVHVRASALPARTKNGTPSQRHESTWSRSAAYVAMYESFATPGSSR